MDNTLNRQSRVRINAPPNAHNDGIVPIVSYAEAIKCEQVLIGPSTIARENLLSSLESVLVLRRDTEVGLGVVVLPPAKILASLLLSGFFGAILTILLRYDFLLNVTDLIHDFALLFGHFQLFLFFSDDCARIDLFFLFILSV